jgi:hypothetical protein
MSAPATSKRTPDSHLAAGVPLHGHAASFRSHATLPRTAARRFAVALSLVALATLAAPAAAFELRLSTENDLLGGAGTKDDLYTFSVGFEVQSGRYAVAYREHAFTDRRAGLRFDESHLTLARPIPLAAPWLLHAEAGVVRVGQGLFGENTQNTVHGALGGDRVELPYAPVSFHARAAATAERPYALGERLELGPRVEADLTTALHSHAVVGAQLRWRPRPGVAVDLLAGARLTHASHRALEPHLATHAPVARLGVMLADRVELSWSYNDRGDEREHLSIGWRASSFPAVRQWSRSQ